MTNAITRTETAYAGKAWIARITGRDPKYGLTRAFLPKRDVTGSGNTYRRIEFAVPAEDGAIYEWFCQEAARRSEKGFFQVRDGRLIAIDRAAVEAAL